MQLTNIARDVGEDAAEGRLCLPLDLLAQVGIDPEAFLADPNPSLALASVVARLLAEADALYLRVESGLAALPAGRRPAMFAARFIHADIGRAVARACHDGATRRARTGNWRKAALAPRVPVRAVTASPSPSRAAAAAPPLTQTAFLVEAVARARVPRRLAAPASDAGRGIAGFLDIIAQLEGRDRGQGAAPAPELRLAGPVRAGF
jgi:phytoene synthase